MCLATVYKTGKDSEEVVLKNVSKIYVEGGSVRLVDIMGAETVVEGSISFVDLALPLGISFYTFQSMGYLLDVYWNRCQAEKNPFRFALFVSFFPQILQGPIGRYSRLGTQLFEEHRWDWSRMERGFQLILW